VGDTVTVRLADVLCRLWESLAGQIILKEPVRILDWELI
jgi:hypothetical protein